jgi:hypothetical protein
MARAAQKSETVYVAPTFWWAFFKMSRCPPEGGRYMNFAT